MPSAAAPARRVLLHVLDLRRGAPTPILAQLALEEALLRADARNWLVLNTGGGGPPAIVMGVAGDASRLVRLDAAAAARVPVVRRFTGGGTVVLDGGSLLVSLVLNRADAPGAPAFPRDIMAWSARAYAPALARLTRGGAFRLADHDYALGDRKVGGNAQSVSRDRFVHHTSWLWDYAPERMALLALPAARPAYRGDRAHADFVGRLRDAAAPGADTPDAFLDGLRDGLVDAWTAGLGAPPPPPAGGAGEGGGAEARGAGGAPAPVVIERGVVTATLEDAAAALAANERRSNEVVHGHGVWPSSSGKRAYCTLASSAGGEGLTSSSVYVRASTARVGRRLLASGVGAGSLAHAAVRGSGIRPRPLYRFLSTARYVNVPLGSVARSDDGVRVDRWLALTFGDAGRRAPVQAWARAGRLRVRAPPPRAARDESEGGAGGGRAGRAPAWAAAALPPPSSLSSPPALSLPELAPGSVPPPLVGPPAALALPSTRLAAGTLVFGDRNVATELLSGRAGDGVAGAAGAGASSAAAARLANELTLLHVDAHVVAVLKPAGVPTQPAEGAPLSLADALPALARRVAEEADAARAGGRDASPPPPSRRGRDGAVASSSAPSRPARGAASSPPPPVRPSHEGGPADDDSRTSLRLVHRLDAPVSGALLLARDRATADALARLFAMRGGLAKAYVGLVAGAPLPHGAPRAGVTNAPVTHAPPPARGGVRLAPLPAPASTAWRVAFEAPGLTAVLLWPATGRKHQLRQHVRALFGGRGLLGDARYGGAPLPAGGGAGGAIALHLAAIGVPPLHDGGGGAARGARAQRLRVDAPLPQWMAEELARHGGALPALVPLEPPGEGAEEGAEEGGEEGARADGGGGVAVRGDSGGARGDVAAQRRESSRA